MALRSEGEIPYPMRACCASLSVTATMRMPLVTVWLNSSVNRRRTSPPGRADRTG